MSGALRLAMFDFDRPPTSTLALTALTGLVLISAKRIYGKSANKRPPGPAGVPIFGNLFQLISATWKDFDGWANKYGDVVLIPSIGQNMLLLNSHTANADLLERRGGNYSDRPHFVVIVDFLTRGLLMAPAHDGELWRKMRRAAHECMSKSATTKYQQLQEREAVVFTENLLRDSKGWYQEVYRTATSGLLSALYDMPPTLAWDDPIIEKINDFEKFLVHAAFPGNYLVEFFPWMKYFPAAISPWKKQAQERFEAYSALVMSLFRNVERQMDEGDEKLGVVGFTIRQRERLGLTDTEASWIPAGFLDGAMANAESLLWFFPAMVAYPEKQKKCQEELDAVVGRSRMPTFEDRDNLPYLRATVRELLRWRPIAPIGAPHLAKQDDWYQGNFIPKGTHCFAHIWYMNRDPKVYGLDADEFNPDRFIDEHGQLIPAIADTKDGHTTYGFGPRICPGRHFANDTHFISFARLLWAATISPAVDKLTGKPVIPDLMAINGDGLTMRPQPFDCVVKPRFAEAPELVARTKELSG